MAAGKMASRDFPGYVQLTERPSIVALRRSAPLANQNRESSGWQKCQCMRPTVSLRRTSIRMLVVSVIKDDTSSPPTERTYFSPACPMPNAKAENEIPNPVVRRANAYIEEQVCKVNGLKLS